MAAGATITKAAVGNKKARMQVKHLGFFVLPAAAAGGFLLYLLVPDFVRGFALLLSAIATATAAVLVTVAIVARALWAVLTAAAARALWTIVATAAARALMTIVARLWLMPLAITATAYAWASAARTAILRTTSAAATPTSTPAATTSHKP